MKKHKKVSTKLMRNVNIANFGRVGVDLDPSSPRWANRQVSALNAAMSVIENLDLTAKELEFLADTFLPQLVAERSPDFKHLVNTAGVQHVGAKVEAKHAPKHLKKTTKAAKTAKTAPKARVLPFVKKAA